MGFGWFRYPIRNTELSDYQYHAEGMFESSYLNYGFGRGAHEGLLARLEGGSARLAGTRCLGKGKV